MNRHDRRATASGNKLSAQQAQDIERTARHMGQVLVHSGLSPADSAMALTMALSFLFKTAFEPNGVTLDGMSDTMSRNFKDITSSMEKVTYQ